MNGKITLITPPDFFENLNTSILFVNLSNDDQDTISKYLVDLEFDKNLNFYVFDNETDIPWLLYAFNKCDYKYVNFDNGSPLISTLGSYLMAKPNSYYSSSDSNLIAMYSHINQNKIKNVISFLERVVDDQSQ
jgi:hypothetical protein